MRLQIDNEYDKLEAVLVHRPGREIDRLNHENMHQFLFEDVPYLKRMQEEHDAFVQVMRDRNVEVYYLTDLLLDIIRDESVRTDVIHQVCQTAVMPAIADELISMKYWDENALVELLFAGITADEYNQATGKRLASSSEDLHFLLPPIPNAYFSRDPAVVVRDTAISSKMHYRERIRETTLVRAVLEHHPEFRDNPITYGGSSEPTEDRPYTIEGGDVIILSPEAVLVGASERTRSETIEILADNCFRYGKVKRLYEIPIPVERAFMHLDTVFTVIDRGTILWFSDVMEKIQYIHRYESIKTNEGVGVQRLVEERSFLDVLRDEFSMELTIINTAGGKKHFASREQRADATNALAIAPRTVITYERNEQTISELESNGVNCIVIDDSELVRGLGGPRCMTMPLRRQTPSA